MKRALRRGIAVVQIIGALLGLAIGIYGLWSTKGQADVPLLPLVLLFILPPMAVGIAGVLWLLGHRWGEGLSAFVWILQIPVLSTAYFGYFFNVGLGWRWMIGPDGLTNYLFLGSQWRWSVEEGAVGTTIGVNIVALFVVILMVWSAARQPEPSVLSATSATGASA